jgi:hypothetical protein
MHSREVHLCISQNLFQTDASEKGAVDVWRVKRLNRMYQHSA